ncbi:response regulator [Paracidovorax valerianellae]|uniref:CheY chemotaxis protein or a CheY-like REC (Receiver) domain n=1 Tax=Paracidovorax valerianellae TaxID=187868 RepID=A0A1G6ZHV9_9BURK|nr:response regulator [Paracidovorax valerianellae]MDA8444299.1 response regulator [Paracidovorax valerianellae]SDE01385.1 CheY chemotaxis protein or a CheY-like REC (receiver) domain [Paracidovorax valerianellae]
MTRLPHLPLLLLVEPQFVLRRTIVSVARDLGLVEFHEATSVARALPVLAARPFFGLVLDCDDVSASTDLLSRLRSGAFACPADMPVLALSSQVDPERDAWREAIGVQDTLRKPFKIRTLLESVQAMAEHKR